MYLSLSLSLLILCLLSPFPLLPFPHSPLPSPPQTLGFTEETKTNLLTCIAAILHLGNINFTSDGAEGKAKIAPASATNLTVLAKLLGCDAGGVLFSLLSLLSPLILHPSPIFLFRSLFFPLFPLPLLPLTSSPPSIPLRLAYLRSHCKESESGA